jgi:hypothetical protein
MLVLCEIYLVHPYGKSFDTLLDLCVLKRLVLKCGGTNKPTCVVGIPLSMWKKWYKENPRPKIYQPINGSQFFIEKIRVIEVIVE